MRNDLPNENASNFGARTRETLMTYLGKQGDPLDRGVTLRDLVQSGFATLTSVKVGGGPVSLLPGTAVAPDPYTPDLTPPPAPTGFTATAGISYVIVEHDDPAYVQGHGHLRTRLYGAIWTNTVPTFADAVEIAQFSGLVYAHPTSFGTKWRLWAKWESVDNVLSASPAGGTNGVAAQTGLVGTSDLTDQIITAAKLVDGSINLGGAKVTGLLANANMEVITDPAKIADSLIGNAKLANLAVDAAKLADSAVTATKIANAAIGTAAIQNGAITNALIANLAVGSAQIANAAITSLKIEAAAVGSAAIANLAVTNAKIANAAIDDAKIANLSASKIKAGTITTGEYIQSSGYAPGLNGWKINGDGTAEFAAATIRGQLIAAQIADSTISTDKLAGTLSSTNYTGTTGWQINKAGTASFNEVALRGAINSGAFTGYAWPTSGTGFHLGPGGLLIGNYNSGKYFQVEAGGNVYAPGLSIVNGTATFSGALSAASGTFAGSLAANTVTAVNIVSNSATSFQTTILACSNGTWATTNFYMDHYGYVAIIANCNFSFSAEDASWSAGIGVDANVEQSGMSGSYYNSSGPPSIGLMTATWLAAGWHTVNAKIYHSGATANHMAHITILRSYR